MDDAAALRAAGLDSGSEDEAGLSPPGGQLTAEAAQQGAAPSQQNGTDNGITSNGAATAPEESTVARPANDDEDFEMPAPTAHPALAAPQTAPVSDAAAPNTADNASTAPEASAAASALAAAGLEDSDDEAALAPAAGRGTGAEPADLSHDPFEDEFNAVEGVGAAQVEDMPKPGAVQRREGPEEV